MNLNKNISIVLIMAVLFRFEALCELSVYSNELKQNYHETDNDKMMDSA